MFETGLAATMKVTAPDAHSLLSGHVTMGVGEALGAQAVHIQAWIDEGSVAPIFADRLRLSPEELEDIGMRLTKKGRIGVIVGMLLDR